jgi:4-alpha-glucanotransferase
MSTQKFKRASGVLLHPTSLPGNYGIGSLGKEAYQFIDTLVMAKQSIWQICPLGPTGYGDSPYQCFSAYAGNPYLIDLESLVSDKLLTRDELADLAALPHDKVDFGVLIPLKIQALRTAYKRFLEKIQKTDPTSRLTAEQFERFSHEERDWLEDYSLFMVIKDKFGGVSWDQWPEEYRKRDWQALGTLRDELAGEIRFHKFLQFEFFRQWRAIRSYANNNGIQIIGDMPIFIAYDSADSWSHPEVFLFDEEGRPSHVAGVPPDYFSATGQLWGNPLYDWDHLRKTNFRWWIDVLKDKLSMYDLIRIDHFRGFSAYWAVPYGDTTAVNGQWVPAPGKELFTAVKEEIGDAPIIAEDLGVITPDVKDLIEFCGFPGMKVLQFAFDSGEENDHLPHTADPNSLMYTGTHDNDTVIGWYANAPERDKDYARRYLKTNGREIHWDFIQAAMASVSSLAVFPLQDILGLGTEARFNFPGTLGNNWNWRMPRGSFNRRLVERLAELTELYGRY